MYTDWANEPFWRASSAHSSRKPSHTLYGNGAGVSSPMVGHAKIYVECMAVLRRRPETIRAPRQIICLRRAMYHEPVEFLVRRRTGEPRASTKKICCCSSVQITPASYVHGAPHRLVQRNEAVGILAKAALTVASRDVADRKLTQVVASHLRLDLHRREDLWLAMDTCIHTLPL